MTAESEQPDDTEPTRTDALLDTDKELQELKLAQAKIEARKAIIEAQKAAVDAAVPNISPDPKGAQLADKAGYIADLVAAAAVKKAAARIADQVRTAMHGKGTSVLLVEDKNLLSADWTYHNVQTELRRYNEGLTEALGAVLSSLQKREVPRFDEYAGFMAGAVVLNPTTVALVASIASKAVQLFGTFRRNYTLTGRQVSISTDAVLCSLADQLLAAGLRVRMDDFRLLSNETGLLQLFAETHHLAQAISTLNALFAKSADVGQKPLLTAAANLAENFSQYANVITTAPDGGNAPLYVALTREVLHGDDPVHLLYVSLASVGGETITSSSSAGYTGDAGFIGGCALSYILLTPDGEIALSDTEVEVARSFMSLKEGRLSRIESEEFE